jgi:predicted component of type VI protein secretion system
MRNHETERAKAQNTDPDEQTVRRSMTAEDDFQALLAIRAWFADHADCRDPAAGVAALGLPDMTGVPQDPHARNGTQRRMAAEAASMLQHAGFAIRNRDAKRRDSES